jgi:hypothetical protein
VCDILDQGIPDPDGPWQPVDILALGVSLGTAFGMHGVTELMCAEHRTHWVMSMLSALARMEKQAEIEEPEMEPK